MDTNIQYNVWLAYWDNPDTNWKDLAKSMAKENFVLKEQNQKLKEQVNAASWRENPDRMGGSFSQEEIEYSQQWERMGR